MNDIFAYDKRKEKIGKRIKELRKKNGLTQEQLADQIDLIVPSGKDKGLGQSTISGWENGTQLPPLPKLIALSEIFNCDISYILHDHEIEKMDVALISQFTGLSVPAINRLMEMHSRIQGEQVAGWVNMPDELELKAINILLANPHSLFYYIYQYLFFDYDTFQMSTTDEQGNDKDVFGDDVLLGHKGKPDKGTFLNISKMPSVFMLEIQKGLMELQNLLHGTLPKNKKHIKHNKGGT